MMPRAELLDLGMSQKPPCIDFQHNRMIQVEASPRRASKLRSVVEILLPTVVKSPAQSSSTRAPKRE